MLQMYENVAVFFAVLAIFSLCASTTEFFQIPFPSSTTNTTTDKTEKQEVVNEEPRGLYQRQTIGPKKDEHFQVSPVLVILDYICLVFFTLEYVVRLLTTPHLWRYISSLSAIIDMVAILPDYLEFLMNSGFPNLDAHHVVNVLTLLRLMRVVRILRVIRRVPGLCIMLFTLKASYRELCLMLLFMLVGTLLFGSVIHFVDDTRIFTSIPRSFWWAIVTMTTVGYGDMVPLTPAGQLVGSITAVCGVLLIAFSIPSLVNNFLCYSVLIQYDANQKLLRDTKQARCVLRAGRATGNIMVNKRLLKEANPV